MQPTLAAIVSKLTVNIIKSVRPILLKVNMVKGTKTINETSLVMNIEEKKQVKVRKHTRVRESFTFANNLRTSISKTARFFKISTTSIMAKSSKIVSQLI